MNTPIAAKRYMLDTTLFNGVLDGKISAASFAGQMRGNQRPRARDGSRNF